MNRAKYSATLPALLGGGVLGLLLFNQLRVEWSLNDQYAYGWFVPLLAAYLLFGAWETRPAANPPHLGGVVKWLATGLLFLLLPVRLVQEANADWRAVSWLLALIVVGIGLCGWYLWGGGKWCCHFAFGTAFILTAIPWPTGFEQAIVLGMMQKVTAASVELLTWFGIPAVAQGTIMLLPGQTVGVSEACSGVRSLQTLVMASLFFGGLYRLYWIRRAGLLFAAVAVAFVVNVLRTTALAAVVFHYGETGLSAWHDRVGFIALLVALWAIWSLAFWIKSPVRKSSGAEALPGYSVTAAVLWGAVAWMGFSELTTETWYRWHERDGGERVRWSVVFPEHKAEFTPIRMEPETLRMLRPSEIKAAGWREPDGTEIAAYFLRWNPSRSATQLARLHRPEICLPSVGCVMRNSLGFMKVEQRGLSIPFQVLAFDYRQSPLYVFYCLQEDRISTDASLAGRDNWTRVSRLRAVWEGRRNRGQRVLELIVRGPTDEAQAAVVAKGLIDEMLRVAEL